MADKKFSSTIITNPARDITTTDFIAVMAVHENTSINLILSKALC